MSINLPPKQTEISIPNLGKVFMQTAEQWGLGILSSGHVFTFPSSVELYHQGTYSSRATSAVP